MKTQTTTRTKQNTAKYEKKYRLKISLIHLHINYPHPIVLPFFINPIANSLVKQQISRIFGDKLKIGSVNVSFLTGAVVKINQVDLAEAPGYGKGSLIKAESIKVRVALMPLLKKQLNHL